MLKKIIASTVAVGLVAGHSVAAIAAPAADRAASPVADAESAGFSEVWLVVLFAAIATGIILLVESNEGNVDDLPASP